MQQKAEFEKEIEKLLFDNREIKEQSRKTQRELSKELTNLTSELKDERDRIHELQKENRKLRQEVSSAAKDKKNSFLLSNLEYRAPDQADTTRELTWAHQTRKCDRFRRSSRRYGKRLLSHTSAFDHLDHAFRPSPAKKHSTSTLTRSNVTRTSY